MSWRFSRLEMAGALLIAAQLGLALLIWRNGPLTPIPVHFRFDGVADGWAGRERAALIMTGLAALTAATGAVMAWSIRRAEDASRRRGLGVGFAVLLLTLLIVCALHAVLALGGVEGATRNGAAMAAMAASGVLAIVGSLLGKVPQNGLVGVRTPWSRASRLSWDKSNRLAGRLLFWGGVGGLIVAPLVPAALLTRAFTFAVLAVALICIFESWRVWRADPDRQPI